MSLPQPVWTIRGGIVDPAPPLSENTTSFNSVAPYRIWGIVNVTPDSFYDGGRHPTPEPAMAHARALTAQGAAVLDVGGASSRPGSVDVDADEEAARVLPVVRGLLTDRKAAGGASGSAPFPLISVDTWRADVA